MNENFNFQNTSIYSKAKEFREIILQEIKVKNPNRFISDQIDRASLSLILNIAEGFGRYQNADKRSFYVNARGSVFECVACLDLIFNSKIPDQYLCLASEIGKMLSGLIKTFSK